MRSFWRGWLRCLGRGVHALVAMVAAGMVVQILMWMVLGLASLLLGGEGKFDREIFDTYAPMAFFLLIGLPLFGLLFSGAYSPTEPGEAAGRAGDGGGESRIEPEERSK